MGGIKKSEKRQALTDQIAENLIEYIQQRQLKSGDKLPNEKQLMEQFDVSRSTIREAMRILISRHIVVARQGAGTFVSAEAGVSEDSLGLKFIYDRNKLIKDILEMRLMLEPPIAAYCAKRASKEDRNELIRLAQEIEFQIITGEDYSEADVAFHCKMASVTGNDIIQIIMPQVINGVRLFISTAGDTPMDRSAQVHKEIALTIYNGDAKEAQKAMIRHLEFDRDVLLQKGFDVAVE